MRSQGLVFPGPNGQKANEAILAPVPGQRFAYVADQETRRFVKTAETKGVMCTLAEPCVAVGIGRSGTFMIGGMCTTTVRTDAGKLAPLELDYGQQVDVVPTMLDQATIRLTMRVELSNLWRPDASATNVEAHRLTGWRVDTTCDTRLGETLILGGFRPLTDSDLLARLTGENATRPSADRPLTRPPADNVEMIMLVKTERFEAAPVGRK
jgi:Flp pilus assembly secretin CpaC